MTPTIGGMHWLAKAAIAVTAATVLSSCSTASVGTPTNNASEDGPEIVVLRPVDGEGKLTSEWNVRPVRGNAEMSCVGAKASPYAVDAGVVTDCAPNPDNTLACWIAKEVPGTVCVTAPFHPKNRFVVQFPTAAHGAPAAPPKSPVPVALELDNGMLCSPIDPTRYRCGTSGEAVAAKEGLWTLEDPKRQVVRTYFFGIAEDEANLAL
jgi:hypothetical protein